MVLKKVGEIKSGKDTGSLAATFDWTDRQGNVILTEDRVMTFHADKDLRTIDFDITLTSVQTVVWGDGKDGAFGIRLRPILMRRAAPGRSSTPKASWGRRRSGVSHRTGATTRDRSAKKRLA